jgi:hypothetical protein
MLASSTRITFLTTILSISCGFTVLNITPFGKLLKHKQEDIKARNLTKGCENPKSKALECFQNECDRKRRYAQHYCLELCIGFISSEVSVSSSQSRYISYVQTHTARKQHDALCIICVFIYQDKRTC